MLSTLPNYYIMYEKGIQHLIGGTSGSLTYVAFLLIEIVCLPASHSLKVLLIFFMGRLFVIEHIFRCIFSFTIIWTIRAAVPLLIDIVYLRT